jgi:regulator of sirC expression with transglutaminase-like and TPR domain
LNIVLEERQGSALSLGVIYLEVGWRLGLPFESVLFPEHFLVKMPVQKQNVLIVDPAAAGRALNAQDLLNRLRQTEKSLHIGQVLAALNSASNHDVLLHFIDNLRSLYAKRRQWQPYIQLCDALLLMKPSMHRLLRDKAEACEQMECFNWALRDYRRYLAADKDADDIIVQRVETLESQVKLMH